LAERAPSGSRAVALLIVLLAAANPAGAQNSKPASVPVEVTWDVRIPMRDGVKLAAVIYRPADSGKRTPVIFVKSPYLADSGRYHEWATYFAQNGYAAAVVDARGRGDSEGLFRPFDGDGMDGYDVVEWLAQQAWCNGKVGMFGGSYDGYGQWSTVAQKPPHLRTVVPTASVGPGLDFPKHKNIFYHYMLQWLTYVSGHTLKTRVFNDPLFWSRRAYDQARNYRPFKEFNRELGNPSPFFDEWISHPAFDSYWQSKMPTSSEYQRIDFPILTITGHYDGDQFGALHYYRSHMRDGRAEIRDKHFLVIGPWDHSGTREPAKEVFGRKFSDASMIDLLKLHRDWYDWTLKGRAKPAFLKQRVAYYAVGAEEWRYAPTLQSVARAHTTLYLDSADEAPNDLYQSGALVETKPRGTEPDRFVIDPLVVTPPVTSWTALEANLSERSNDRLVYYSAPFEDERDVAGFVRLEAWMELDVPDADIDTLVSEVRSDGSSTMLGSTTIRSRYRDSLVEQKLVRSGEVNRYEFTFYFTAMRIQKKSRLRLLIQAAKSASHERNYNSGGAVAEESKKDARTAHVKLYHDAKHLSLLEIPLGRPEAKHVKVAAEH
jgi:putative CocE/NonD family hydrolase